MLQPTTCYLKHNVQALTYTPWVQASRPRTAADTLEKLYRHFRTWYSEPLAVITVERVEAWKARRLHEGRSASTVVRDLIQAWRPLLVADEDQTAKATRDPVAPAKRSSSALEKVHSHFTEDGTPAHSLRTLLAELATLVRNTCKTPGNLERPATFDLLTTPTALQRRAFDLIDHIAV